MQGPLKLKDDELPPISPWEQKRFIRAKRYRVFKPFADADGDLHPASEEWIFLAAHFSQIDDELILHVGLPTGDWKIPLSPRDEDQKKIIDRPDDYFIEL